MTRMGWVTTGDVAEFLAEAGPFLRQERARNTILLTVAETARANPRYYASGGAPASDETANGEASGDGLANTVGSPLYGWWTPDLAPATGTAGMAGTAGAARAARAAGTAGAEGPDSVRGAFLQTPPFPVVLSGMPAQAAAELAAKTLAGRPISGVTAHAEAAAAFSAVWAEHTGGTVTPHLRSRLYRLAELAGPDPLPDGAPRVAGDGDAALLTEWFEAFSVEVHEMAVPDHAAAVRERLSYGGLTLWEVRGEPVCVVGLTRQVAGMVRVGPVYTPPRQRGRGYASAATAEVSRSALAAGAQEVLLYTDLENPVSNSIYQRIGYREVEDRVVLAFSKH
jgi:RimJ/RimL family protein N-acetyltransferase